MSKALRSYKLKLSPNSAKFDTARYAIMRHNQYANMFLGKLFFGQRRISTSGMGDLANQALYDSIQIVRRQRAATKATGNKANVPFARRLGCRAIMQESRSSFYDYWFAIPNQFTKTRVLLPAKSHKALNKAIRSGWKFTRISRCMIVNGSLYAVVYVSKEAPKMQKPKGVIGADVGYKYSVCTSIGHIGRNISKVLRRTKQIRADRQRMGIRTNSQKTAVKQVLDREAKKLIGRSKKLFSAIAVEDPKKLAPLTGRNLHGWACSYVAKRLEILGKEEGVLVLNISPYATSIECSKCHVIDKQHRVSRGEFKCSCGFEDHADLNAAKNIARKGFLKLSEKATIKRGKSCQQEGSQS